MMDSTMENVIERKAGLTSFQLKVLAIISMLIDHMGVILYPEAVWLRYVGRLAFPIFCFLLVEGYYHTRNVAKYIARLGIFVIVSEIPFDLAFHQSLWYPEKQNVFVTLFIALGMLWFLDREREIITRVGIVIFAMWAAEFMHSDYGFRGVLLVAVFWMTREKKAARYIAGAAWNFLWPSKIQTAGALAMLPIALYNGQRGRSMKYFFYVFYPLHLLFLYFLVNIHM